MEMRLEPHNKETVDSSGKGPPDLSGTERVYVTSSGCQEHLFTSLLGSFVACNSGKGPDLRYSHVPVFQTGHVDEVGDIGVASRNTLSDPDHAVQTFLERVAGAIGEPRGYPPEGS